MYGGGNNPLNYIIIIVVFVFIAFVINYFYNKSKNVKEESTKPTSSTKVDEKIVLKSEVPTISTPKSDVVSTPKSEVPVVKSEVPVVKSEVPVVKSEASILLAPKLQTDFRSNSEWEIYQEKLKKQENDMILFRTCGNNNILPCKTNFIEIDVNNDINQKVKCCIPKDSRNEVKLFLNAKSAFYKSVGDDPNYDIGLVIFTSTKNKYNENTIKELLEKFTSNIQDKMLKKATNSLEKLIAKNTEINIQKIVFDIMSRNNTIISKILTDLSNKILVYKSKASSNIKISPSDWTNLTVDSYYKNINKNLKESTYIKELTNIKKNSNEVLSNELKTNNYEIPLIVNPLYKIPMEETVVENSKLPNINVLVNQIITEFSFEYVNLILELIIDKLFDLSSIELSELINLLYEDGILYFNTDKGSEYLDKKLCIYVNGYHVPKNCIYKDKKACDESYDWLKVTNDKNSSERYAEFRDLKCVLSNPTMRRMCENNNLKYNEDTQLCDVDEIFCKSRNLDFIANTSINNFKDCKLPIDKNLDSNLFGDKLIIEVKESYDSKKYKQCNEKEFDSLNTSQNLATILESSQTYTHPFNIPSIIYKGNPNKTCIEEKVCPPGKKLRNGVCFEDCKAGYIEENNVCYKKYTGFDLESFGDISGNPSINPETPSINPETPSINPETPSINPETPNPEIPTEPYQEEVSQLKLLPKKIDKKISSNKPIGVNYCSPNQSKENLLCYDKCNDGFKSDGAVLCYKQYPDFENNGRGHTITSITKKIDTNTGKPLSTCPADKSKENLLCYDKCKDGFKSDGAVLCYKQYPDFEKNGRGHTITNITKKIDTNTGKPLSTCPPDKSKENLLCYDKCKDGFSSDGAVTCYKNAPSNWPGGQSLTHLQHKTHYTGPGKPLTDCKPDQDKSGLLCYPKCKDGFTSDNLNTCYKNAPSNWPGGQSLTHLQHKTHYTGPGKPLTDCNSNQDKNGALCYPKCNSGYNGVGPVCWGSCGDKIDVGALCRERCRSGFNDVAGVCWGSCGGKTDVGALCRDTCNSGYHEVAGVCWENTPSGSVSVGALIRDGCRSGYHDVAGVCWANGCPSGWNDDGAFCREPLRTVDNGYYNWSWGRWGCHSGYGGWDGWSGYSRCYKTWIVRLHTTGGTVKAKDTYVPTTRTRGSYVPSTTAKPSYVPSTTAKPSYGRGAGEPLKCAPGLEQRGALCYENCAKYNTNGVEYERRNDNIDMCSTKCPPGQTNIGIGGCQREKYGRPSEPLKCAAGLEQRGALCYENCNKFNSSGVEFERRDDNIDMCSTKCPPGQTNIGIGGCQREKYNRGIGKPMECAPGQTQDSLGLCYEACPKGYSKQSLGLCSQDCPPGSKDMGVGCVREAYSRGIGKPMECAPGQTQDSLGLCYEACPKGYSKQSLGLCSQDCPPGSKDFGVGCTREAYNRGVGKPMGCAPNQTKRNGEFCYKNCPDGSSLKDDGKCTTVCPPGTKDTGTSCERESYSKDPGVLPYSLYVKERIEPYIIKNNKV